MKNYHEVTNDLLARRDCYVAQQKIKRKRMLAAAAGLCCVCLIALLGVDMQQSRMPDSEPPVLLNGTSVTGEKDLHNYESQGSTSAPTGNATVPTQDRDGDKTPERLWLIHVNGINSSVAAAKRYYDPQLHYDEVWDNVKMAAHLGIDLSALSGITTTTLNPAIPDGVSYTGSTNHTVTFKNDGTLVFDSASFIYTGEDKKILILASKLGTPYHTLYMLETETPTTFKTKNNGLVDVVIGGKPYNTIEAYSDEEGFFVADFELNGLYYRVTAENMTAYEFEQIIRGIVE